MKRFILNSIAILITFANKITKKNLKQGFDLSNEEISIKDDGFHGAGLHPFTEWWYFDASFKNRYSVSMAVRIIGFLKLHICIQRMDIYKNGKRICNKRNLFFPNNFFMSKSRPLIKIDGKKVMEGFIDKQGIWNHKLSFKIDNIYANLKFIGTSKGWKSKVPGSRWNVIIPRAKVTGNIQIDNEKTNVEGLGYHDHNWNVRPSTILNIRGWFWGRFNSKNFIFIWSDVVHSKDCSTLIFAINQKNNGYLKIDPKNIKFTKKDIRKEKNKKIPHGFKLNITDDKIFLDVEMRAIDVSHTKVMGFMNYWRYQMTYKGTYKVDDLKEEINDCQIAELLQFFRF